MSTETPAATPDMAKKSRKDKKRKHEKHSEEDSTTHKSSKKRKHSHEGVEVPATQPTTQPEELRKKKHRKDKSQPFASSATAIPSTQTTSKLSNDQPLSKHSPFVQKTTSLYLPLSPAAYAIPLAGLCAEHISPLLLTYYPPLRGVVLSYSNPRISEHPDQAIATKTEDNKRERVLGKQLDEYAPSYLWLTATFTLFAPARGTWLEGYVNVQNEEMLGLVCYNYFNAVIEREKLPKDWRWVGDGTAGAAKRRGRDGRELVDGNGWFVDGQGDKVEGRVVFCVEGFEAGVEGGVGTVGIVGTMRGEGEK
ncbi:hypothetical protein LTR09_009492 [Extremus antarcticus]|uniref:DNA-directed RNA polymerase subunit n=1 Tax=Extremus antarcticus TaxID=702011 RepID=A0AAJ0D8V4_9PEZI|nr:hypothetical protein LTR09_009492 [Extremus antarcticus]